MDTQHDWVEEPLIDIEEMSLDTIKDLLESIIAEEQRLSYRRRVLHGKIDILRAEMARRLRAAHEEGQPVVRGTDIDRLVEILASDLRGVSRFDVTAPNADEDQE